MDTPWWKKVFDAAEQRAAPPLGRALSNPNVIEAITLTMAVQRRASEDLAEFVRRQLHLANLPAGTDVQKVSNQIASLERQIRLLNRRLDDLGAASESDRAVDEPREEQG
jgi:hypothetical protein